MELTSLAELYVEELRGLYGAEKQIMRALPKMIKAASHRDLKRAFTTHERQTRGHVTRLERIFKQLGERPKAKKSIGMEGLLEEGAALIKEKPSPEVLDAGLITKAQCVEHYEMACYGAVRTYAALLGRDDHRRLLQQTLDEERETDKLLTDLAERSINSDADVQVPAARAPKSAARRRTRRADAEVGLLSVEEAVALDPTPAGWAARIRAEAGPSDRGPVR